MLSTQTIANVALPFMQNGSFSASFDEINWVLTSYITASAIMTAPVRLACGALRPKSLYVGSILGFTITSMLCGAARSLEQIVVFRVLQGAFGAALAPLSQATLLDIYPPERRGFAMAILGVGIMLGPIMGPTLGGWLTETCNWRWVFYINLPFGLLAATGLMIFLPSSDPQQRLRFDWLGFGMLAIAIGAMQLMLDRGQGQDWFTSREIVVEAVFAGLGLYLVLVHFLAAPHPLIRLALLKDVNFASGVLLIFMVGIFMVSALALMTPWLQVMSHYHCRNRRTDHGAARRGSLVTTMLTGRLASRVDISGSGGIPD